MSLPIFPFSTVWSGLVGPDRKPQDSSFTGKKKSLSEIIGTSQHNTMDVAPFSIYTETSQYRSIFGFQAPVSSKEIELPLLASPIKPSSSSHPPPPPALKGVISLMASLVTSGSTFCTSCCRCALSMS